MPDDSRLRVRRSAGYRALGGIGAEEALKVYNILFQECYLATDLEVMKLTVRSYMYLSV
jgi:HEAT repeat protein